MTATTAHRLSAPAHARTIIFVLLTLVFAPYVIPQLGFRLDHLVIYTLALYASTQLVAGTRRRMLPFEWSLVLLWSGSLLWLLVVTFTAETGQASARALVAAIENLTQPLALFIILGTSLWSLTREEATDLLQRALVLVVTLLSINALVAILSIFVDIWPFISPFFPAEAEQETVWGLATTMGRHSGLFNQPAEAGIAYSVALLGWVYLVMKRSRVSAWLLLGAPLIIAGGLLTVSKVFVLGGIPLALVTLLWCINTRSVSRLLRIVLATITAFAVMASLDGWAGWGFLERLFQLDGRTTSGLVQLFTAGRFGGEEAIVNMQFQETLAQSPLYGFGLASSPLPLDNAFSYYMFQGGLVALLYYLCILGLIGAMAIRLARGGTLEGKFVTAMWIVIVGSSLGVPVLILNRASILLWVLLLVAIHAITTDSDKRVYT